MSLQKISMGAVIAIAVTGLFLTLVSAGVLTSSQTVGSTGTVSSINVGVYSDSACTVPLTSIAWGTVAPGGSTTKTVYVKNTGTVQMTLSMTKANWNPAGANGPISITWDREGTAVAAGQVATAVLTLAVSSSISGISTYSVDITIVGTG